MLKFNKNIFLALASVLMLALVSCNSDEDFSEIIAPPTSGETGGTGDSENPDPVRPSNPEGVGYYRPRTSTSNDTCNAVYEYMPAPGQFIRMVLVLIRQLFSVTIGSNNMAGTKVHLVLQTPSPERKEQMSPALKIQERSLLKVASCRL